MSECCLHYIFCIWLFEYDKVYGGTFWYTNVYKEYGVSWCTFVKTGYGGIFFKGLKSVFWGFIT